VSTIAAGSQQAAVRSPTTGRARLDFQQPRVETPHLLPPPPKPPSLLNRPRLARMAVSYDHTIGIYLRGINEDTTEFDCRSVFSPFGTITEVVLKGERSWAVVNFSSAAEAAAAAAGGVTSVGGLDVEVAARTPQWFFYIESSVNIYLKGLDEQTTREEVIGALESFGEVTSVKLQSDRGFAFAAMDSVEAAAAAVAAAPLVVGELEGVECEMRRSRAPQARKPRAQNSESRAPKDLSKDIYIKGLPELDDGDSNEGELRSVFEQYGTIERVMLRKGRDFAFISFAEGGSVAMAVDAGNGGGIVINGESVTVEARTGRKVTAE
jgi:RNA recognition motif-containing protein